MKDEFRHFNSSPTAPAIAAEVIVPSDIEQLEYATRGLYVGTGGDLTVQMLDGDPVVLRNLQGGVLYPLRVSQVMATGTTAADLVGLR